MKKVISEKKKIRFGDCSQYNQITENTCASVSESPYHDTMGIPKKNMFFFLEANCRIRGKLTRIRIRHPRNTPNPTINKTDHGSEADRGKKYKSDFIITLVSRNCKNVQFHHDSSKISNLDWDPNTKP